MTCDWKTAGKHGPSETEIEVIASEVGKDERRGTVLTLRADVIPDYTYSPEELVFRGDRPETRKVAVRPAYASSVSLTGASVDHRAFEAKLNAETCEVSVSFDPELWHDHRGSVSLVVRTNSPQYANFRVPLRVFTPVRARSSVDPGEANLVDSPNP